MATKKKDTSFRDFVLDQLADLDHIVCKRMFGGYGIYQQDTFFAIICNQNHLYFKTNEHSRERYIQHGMGPFQPTPKQTLKNYYQLPTDILEDADALQTWAKESIAVASL